MNPFEPLNPSSPISSLGQLPKAFVLSAQDRFLTFTVSGLNLQSNSTQQNGQFTAAPQDAFEVALLSADTDATLQVRAASDL